jgi:hypothetical protein
MTPFRAWPRLNRNDALHLVGEHSRPGCGSARPRAEPERTGTHRVAGGGDPPEWTARARSTAPEAGALPPSQLHGSG